MNSRNHAEMQKYAIFVKKRCEDKHAKDKIHRKGPLSLYMRI